MWTEKFHETTNIPELAAIIHADEYNSYHEHVSALVNKREHFIETGEILSGVRKEIAKSWNRCRERGLLPTQVGVTVVTQEELSQAKQRNAYLIRTALPIMHSVQGNMGNANTLCVTYLTDSEGIILELVISEMIIEFINELGLKEGAIWNEEKIGTNAISLALEYDRPFCTYAPEHYLHDHTFVNCVSAPIHNNDGKIVGAITSTFYKEFYNEFSFALLSTAADLIEEKFMNLRNSAIIEYTLYNASEGVLLLDSSFNIVQINKRFQQLLQDPQIKADALDFKMLFKDIDLGALKKEEDLHTPLGETFLSYQKIYSRVNIDLYRIEEFGNVDGYVVICRDVADILALTQQFVGSETRFSFASTVTSNSQMLSLIRQCKKVASKNIPILLEGESGTGKEVFAQSIHNASNRSNKPFVAVNCAALPISLVESELFGYEKGAFTDGLATGKAGKFELANGGTIFLDEIGELSLDIQAKLLRVLDNHSVIRIGGKTDKKLDIRVIVATNRDLLSMVQARAFREDLYYRINVISFRLPPLSERVDDIPLLITYFVDHLNMENRGLPKKMDEECVRILSSHTWKGNVRELQNAVTRAYHLCNEQTISSSCLVNDLLEDAEGAKKKRKKKARTKSEMEIELIKEALDNSNGNVAQAAEQVGMSRATFYRKMKFYEIA